MVQGDIPPKRRLVGYAAALLASIAVTIGCLPLNVGTARDYIGPGVVQTNQRGQPYSWLGAFCCPPALPTTVRSLSRCASL